MAVYNTKGKRAVIEILQNNPERQLSVEDIFVSLGENAPGQSSIYRILSSLQKSGEVRREKKESGEGYVYQYAKSLGCNDHFHLKCRACGKVTHLRCHVSDELFLIFSATTASLLTAENPYCTESAKNAWEGCLNELF